MGYDIRKFDPNEKYEITVRRLSHFSKYLGRYEILARLDIGDGEMANMFFNENTFSDVLAHVERLRTTKEHLRDAAVYYIDSDEQRSRYDLNDSGNQVMLALLLSDLDRV